MNVPASAVSPFVPKLARKFPVVAIVGRPNVGKSTLFNRLVGERKAIVDDFPGVTRDRNYAEAEWDGRKYLLVDTGGLESDSNGNLAQSVQAQSRVAVAEADVVVFLFDGKGGLNPLDREAVDLLRRQQKPVLFAVNKLDSRQRADNLYEFFALGIDPLYSISAEHGLGVTELFDAVTQNFPALESRQASDDEAVADEVDENHAPRRVAIVGRPNVGKSTLINRLLGFERSVVDSMPGTTRDSLDTPFELLGEPCILVDTAGIRRKARIDNRVERFSVSSSLRSVERGDLIIHVIDGPEGVTDQDAQILSFAVQRGKALVLAVNKWDLVAEGGGDMDKYREEVNYHLSFLDFVPVSFISAASGFGVRKLLETGVRVLRAYGRKISTSVLNQALQKIVRAHTVPLFRDKAVKFYYGTQTGTRPPTFTFFLNIPSAVPESYQRYLTHHLREELGLDYTPIRLHFRARREEKKPPSPMIAAWSVVTNERGIVALLPRTRAEKKISSKRGANKMVRWRRRVEIELRDYFAGRSTGFNTPYDINGLTPFTRAVLRLTAQIPYGQVRSYKWIADKLGKPKAARAVGNALARNPIPIIIPCHRVVRRDGVIGPFVFGSKCKKKLLRLEKQFANSATSLRSPRA